MGVLKIHNLVINFFPLVILIEEERIVLSVGDREVIEPAFLIRHVPEGDPGYMSFIIAEDPEEHLVPVYLLLFPFGGKSIISHGTDTEVFT